MGFLPLVSFLLGSSKTRAFSSSVIGKRFAVPTIQQRQLAPSFLTTSATLLMSGTSSSNKSNNDIAKENQSSAENDWAISKNIVATLDPCVVLMKQMISEYSHLWQGDKGGIMSLAQGVVYWDPPPTVSNALLHAIQPGSDASKEDANSINISQKLHMYGPEEGLPELQEALMKKIAQENGLQNHKIMVTTGANQAYMNVVLGLLSPPQQCIIFTPYYFNHVMALQMVLGDAEDSGGVVLGPCNDQGVPDLDWLERTLADNDNIAAITLTNPGNPTGVALPQTVMQQIVDITKRHKKWLILDCTYEHFVHDKQEQQQNDDDSSSRPPLKFSCFPDNHIVHIFSFSKGYALAGYRCGYIVVHQDRYQQLFTQSMLKVQDTIPISPSIISQVAALGALKAGRSWVLNQVKTLDTGRQAIRQALKNAGIQTQMGGTGAMYVMAKLPSTSSDATTMDDEWVARQLVRDFGVAIIPGSYCGFAGWIRVCYSNLPPSKCVEAAQRLERGLKSICSKS